MMHNFDAISHLINSSTYLKFDKKICQECTWSVSLFEIHTIRPPPLWFVNDTLLISLFTALSWPVILSFSIKLTIHPHNRGTFWYSTQSIWSYFTEFMCKTERQKSGWKKIKMENDIRASRIQSNAAEKWKRKGDTRRNYLCDS